MDYNTSEDTNTHLTFIFPDPPKNLNCRKTYNKLRAVLGLPEKDYQTPKTAREIIEDHEKEEKKRN